MLTIIYLLVILVSLLLIGAVLLQPGKGDMLTGMSGIGGQFNSMFGSRRATDMLMKITIGLASLIAALALLANVFFVGGEITTEKPSTEGRAVKTSSTPAPAALPSPESAPAPAN